MQNGLLFMAAMTVFFSIRDPHVMAATALTGRFFLAIVPHFLRSLVGGVLVGTLSGWFHWWFLRHYLGAPD